MLTDFKYVSTTYIRNYRTQDIAILCMVAT